MKASKHQDKPESVFAARHAVALADSTPLTFLEICRQVMPSNLCKDFTKKPCKIMRTGL